MQPTLLAELGHVTDSKSSPLAHLLCHGPDRRAAAASVGGAPPVQPPMKHGNPADDRSPSPMRGKAVVIDPAATEKTMEEKRRAREMRKERKRREREKLEAELAEAERQAEAARLARDQERQRREEELRARLDDLRERKAQRELEFLVSEKRAQQVRASKSLADVIQEQYEQRLAAEEEERQRQLQERRERMHAPVLSGLEAVQRHFHMVEERRRRKQEELAKRKEEIESSKPSPYHGSSYEAAAEDFIKLRHGEEDQRHRRLYKHAKMTEYGNLVRRLYGPEARTPPPGGFDGTVDSAVPQRSPRPPFVTAGHQVGGAVASPVVRKDSLAPQDRNKTGNQYLREALAAKPHAGVRLQPIEDPRDKEYEAIKARKKKGDQYLREVRDLPLRRSHPEAGRSGTAPPGPAPDEESRMQDLRRLKSQTASLENRLRTGGVDLQDPEACLESNEQYLDLVRLKLEMLRRAPPANSPKPA